MLVNGQYLLNGIISSGGFGTVFYAYDQKSHRRVAVKQLRVGTLSQEELIKNEIKTISQRLAGLRFVPRFYGAYQEGSEVYLVMEYIEGKTLDQVRALPWAPESVERFLSVMLDQLQRCHEHQVIHRDLKPRNIIRNNADDYILIDFGISKLDNVTQKMAKGFGTPDYASPEQALSQTTSPQSDLYSLGMIAYELLVGQSPPNVYIRLGGAALTPPSSHLANVPPRLEKTIMALLQLRAADRPASAAQALLILRDPPPLIKRSSGQPMKPDDIVAGLAGLVLMCVIIVFVIGNGPGTPPPPTLIPLVELPSGRLVFASDREGGYDLFLADAGGGPPWNLTQSPQDEVAPIFAPTENYLVYLFKHRDTYGIARLDLATMERRELMPPKPDWNYGTPMPSPDGRRIAYNAGPLNNLDLYVMDANGSNTRMLADSPSHDYHPAWLPDGTALVYVVQEQTSSALMLLTLDGNTAPVELYRTEGRLSAPAVSPDGRMIAFAERRSNGESNIYRIPVQGGPAERVTNDIGNATNPSWSSDGQRLMFSATPATGDERQSKIYLIDRDGSNLQQIFADTGEDIYPYWVP
ncbi:protein kinase [Candidatus Chloroploca sp. Khr17]|uniref:protein kinase domain-containing protein n=1 Tax=Candidatus Chloroploca sp. Khr17 TaxID=2496869 RepID=UPI0013EDDAA8|nr:protein kinase [Candidatus Chloroploca sp. Khr17]